MRRPGIDRFHEIKICLLGHLIAHMNAVVGIEHPMNTHEDAAIGVFALCAIDREIAIRAELSGGQLILAWVTTKIIEGVLVGTVEFVREELKGRGWFDELPENAKQRPSENRVARRIGWKRRRDIIGLIAIRDLRATEYHFEVEPLVAVAPCSVARYTQPGVGTGNDTLRPMLRSQHRPSLY